MTAKPAGSDGLGLAVAAGDDALAVGVPEGAADVLAAVAVGLGVGSASSVHAARVAPPNVTTTAQATMRRDLPMATS